MPKDSHQLAEVRTDILRGLHSVTVYRTALSCTRLAQKHKRYTNIPRVTARLNICVGMCSIPADRGCNLWSVSNKVPLDATTGPFRPPPPQFRIKPH